MYCVLDNYSILWAIHKGVDSMDTKLNLEMAYNNNQVNYIFVFIKCK